MRLADAGRPTFLATFFVTLFLVAFFAAFRFRARAARAFTRFLASVARASGDMGRRFFATFLIDFFAAVLRVVVDGARPTAGRTTAMPTFSSRVSPVSSPVAM